jgi:hypothetical protein
LHIGGGAVLKTSGIIGLFDLDGTTKGRSTQNFLRRREKDKRLFTVTGDGLPRSFILTAPDSVYVSPVTAETLNRRLQGTEKRAWIK